MYKKKKKVQILNFIEYTVSNLALHKMGQDARCQNNDQAHNQAR